MQLSYHPAPGVNPLPPGMTGGVVTANGTTLQLTRRPTIGELMPALFSMPENPLLRGLQDARARAAVNYGDVGGMGGLGILGLDNIDVNTVVKYAVYAALAWMAYGMYTQMKHGSRSSKPRASTAAAAESSGGGLF